MLPENELPSGRDFRSSWAGTRSLVRIGLKRMLGSAVRFLPRVQRSIDKGLTVFAFHDISDSPSEFASQFGLVVSTTTFERQIQWIKANFEVIHPSAILASEPLPSRAAMITFDDGYRGTFENGLPILERMGVPSIIFLNMQAVLSGTPVLSATACFLDRYEPNFKEFCEQRGLRKPFHLTLNPRVFAEYLNRHGDINYSVVTQFQGPFADLSLLQKWDASPLVRYGNHLFEHWNAAALSPEELRAQYLDNEIALSRFANMENLFAFTNGQPITCFSQQDVEMLQLLGAGKVFSTAGGVNRDARRFLLGRIALCESDNDATRLWFRIGRAVFHRDIPLP